MILTPFISNVYAVLVRSKIFVLLICMYFTDNNNGPDAQQHIVDVKLIVDILKNKICDLFSIT